MFPTPPRHLNCHWHFQQASAKGLPLHVKTNCGCWLPAGQIWTRMQKWRSGTMWRDELLQRATTSVIIYNKSRLTDCSIIDLNSKLAHSRGQQTMVDKLQIFCLPIGGSFLGPVELPACCSLHTLTLLELQVSSIFCEKNWISFR